jgi:threonine synthase
MKNNYLPDVLLVSDETGFGHTAFDQKAFHQTSFEQKAFGQTSFDQKAFDQKATPVTSSHQIQSDQRVLAQRAVPENDCARNDGNLFDQLTLSDGRSPDLTEERMEDALAQAAESEGALLCPEINASYMGLVKLIEKDWVNGIQDLTGNHP